MPNPVRSLRMSFLVNNPKSPYLVITSSLTITVSPAPTTAAAVTPIIKAFSITIPQSLAVLGGGRYSNLELTIGKL